MRTLSIIIAFIFLGAIVLVSADEKFIVNTGPGPHQLPGWSVGEGYQWLAGKFTVDSPVTVSSVKVWLCCDGGLGEIAILQDGGDVPGAVLYN